MKFCNFITVVLLSTLLRIHAQEADWGNFPVNIPQKTQFTITNSHAYPLQILRVRSGCPCVEAFCDKKSLAPGGEITNTTCYPTGEVRHVDGASYPVEYTYNGLVQQATAGADESGSFSLK